MLKRLFFILTLLVLFLFVTACSPTDSDTVNAQENITTKDNEQNDNKENGSNSLENDTNDEGLDNQEASEEELTDEDMIKIGQELLTNYFMLPETTDKEAFDKILQETFSNIDIIESLTDCCYNPESDLANTQVIFTDDTVLQVGKDEFEYSTQTEILADNFNDEYISTVLAIIKKEDNQFKISYINFDPITDTEN